MTINFRVLCESFTFSWDNVKYIPRIGEQIAYGSNRFIVREIIWIDTDYIDILLDRK